MIKKIEPIIRYKVLIICTFVMLLILTPVCKTFAQLDSPGDPPPTDTPFDGGVIFLLAAGMAYGIKKARDLQNKKS